MDHPPTTLDTYRESEQARLAHVIDEGVYAHDTPMAIAGRLHYEGWRRRYEISSVDRDQANDLPAGTLIKDRLGEYRVSYYLDRTTAQGVSYTQVWFKRLGSDHAGCPPNVLDYPITVLDTP